jgi:hypothetical protein
MARIKIDQKVQITGFTAAYTKSIEVEATGGEHREPTVAAAKAGTLTTRTSDTVGTLTMAGGHGIATGDEFDLFWSGGQRAQVTAGVVAGDSVPFSLGTGDVLPALNTVITAHKGVSAAFTVVGDNLTGISVQMDKPGYVHFRDNTDAVLFSAPVTADGGYVWYDGSGVTNPLAGDTVTSILCTNSDSTAARSPQVGVVFN